MIRDKVEYPLWKTPVRLRTAAPNLLYITEMTGNITIHSAVWATICGHIEFTLNFDRKRYVLYIGSGMKISPVEYTNGEHKEKATVDTNKEKVLKLISQSDSGMWIWTNFMSTWLGFAACQKKNEDLVAYGEFGDYCEFKKEFLRK